MQSEWNGDEIGYNREDESISEGGLVWAVITEGAGSGGQKSVVVGFLLLMDATGETIAFILDDECNYVYGDDQIVRYIVTVTGGAI